jgi:hypothetical protein
VSGADNILKVFARADRTDLDEGLAAYFRYRQTMEAVGKLYGYTLEQTAAAFSALSPNNDYVGNLRSLVSVIVAHKEARERGEEPGETERFTVSSYRACARRALLYLSGTPFLEHAKGPKTRSFYLNITQPWLPYHVTVDGHMVSVWTGERLRVKEVARSKALGSGRRYGRVADDFRLVAYRLGILPNQVQAVTWFAWKRINRIVFDSQMSLLRPSDQWNLHMRPEEIRPFEYTENMCAGLTCFNRAKPGRDYCSQTCAVEATNAQKRVPVTLTPPQFLIARELLDELLSSEGLRVCMIPSEEDERGLVRAVESANPRWYSEFCSLYQKGEKVRRWRNGQKRPSKNSHPNHHTIIDRRRVVSALQMIVERGEAPAVYGERLHDFIVREEERRGTQSEVFDFEYEAEPITL